MSAPTAGDDTRFAQAVALADQGRLADAAACATALVRERPRHAQARHLLGALLHRLGHPAAALAELDAAIVLLPDHANLANLRAEVLLAAGQPALAIDAANAALAIDAEHAGARFHLGLALLGCARHDEAAAILAALIDAAPDWPAARHACAHAYLSLGERAAALACANHAVVIDNRTVLQAVLADFAAAGAIAQRIELLRAALARHPGDFACTVALASDLHLRCRPSEALHWAERALAQRPHARMPREIRATALVDRGEVEAGLAAYSQLLRDGNAETQARHLVLMHYDPAQDNATLFQAHHDFAQRHLRSFGPGFAARARDPEKILRVGWLSPRLDGGPVASFLGGLLARYDRSRHRHLLIALQPAREASGRDLQALADEAVDASGLDDARLLRRLRELDLDVLVDLAGHATANRIGVVAQRVAPLQVCWLDWFDTTAVPAMDAWFSDAWLTPPDSSQRYSERLVRLDAGRFCYTPPRGSPPAERDGGGEVVFGSFNRLAKLNDAVLDAWAEILRRLPGARLELRAHHLGEAATRDHLVERFHMRGIDAARLRIHGHAPYAELLEAYRRVDVALDPFPFSGCTTTCDALWMGCPTITLPGDTFVSRQSASLLWRLGRDEWIARDRADYVERAVDAARSVDALRAGRADLRAQTLRALCDADRHAADFAARLRGLWRERCAQA